MQVSEQEIRDAATYIMWSLCRPKVGKGRFDMSGMRSAYDTNSDFSDVVDTLLEGMSLKAVGAERNGALILRNVNSQERYPFFRARVDDLLSSAEKKEITRDGLVIGMIHVCGCFYPDAASLEKSTPDPVEAGEMVRRLDKLKTLDDEGEDNGFSFLRGLSIGTEHDRSKRIRVRKNFTCTAEVIKTVLNIFRTNGLAEREAENDGEDWTSVRWVPTESLRTSVRRIDWDAIFAPEEENGQ